jgi:hypothetical protein
MNTRVRWLSYAFCGLAVCVSLGCADKPTAPRGTMATIRVATTIGAQSTPAVSVDIYVGYVRTNNEIVPLLKERALVSSTNQDVTIRVDLTTCLRDDERPAPLDACVLRIDAVLRDENDIAIDSITAPSVTASPGSSVTAPRVELTAGVPITATFCNDASATLFAAYQDGTGSWTPLSLVNGSAGFRIKSGRGGLLWVRPVVGGGYAVMTQFATVAELGATATAATCTAPIGTNTVTGSVTGLGANETAFVSLGLWTAVVTATAPSFSILNVVPGTYPMIAVRYPSQSFVPIGVTVLRSVAAQSNANLGTIAVSGAPLESHPLTVANGGANAVTVGVSFRAAGQTALAGIGSATNSTSWWAVPASSRVPGDLHIVSATVIEAGNSGSFIAAEATVATPGPRSLTMGPSLTAPTITVISTQPSVRISATVQVPPEYSSTQVFTLAQGLAATRRTFFLQVSEAYRQSAPTVSLVVPDMSTLAGWDANWGLKPGIATSWGVTALGITGGTFAQPYVDGATQRTGYRQGTITP